MVCVGWAIVLFPFLSFFLFCPLFSFLLSLFFFDFIDVIFFPSLLRSVSIPYPTALVAHENITIVCAPARSGFGISLEWQ